MEQIKVTVSLLTLCFGVCGGPAGAIETQADGSPVDHSIPASFSLYDERALNLHNQHLELKKAFVEIRDNIRVFESETCKAQVMMELAIEQHRHFGQLSKNASEAFDQRLASCG